MVSVSRRSARGPSECCRSTADAARALFLSDRAQGGSNDDARARVDIRRQKRPATLCISTVSIRARPHDEPLPVWIAPWRYASKRASAIDRRTHLHVNIRPSKRLAALCISTVSICTRSVDEPLRYGLPLVGSLRIVLLLSIERVRSCGYPSVGTTRGTVYFDGEPPRPSARRAPSGMDCPLAVRFQTCVSYRSENARPCGYPACSITRSAVVFNGEGARMAGRQRSSAGGQLPRQPVEALCISTVRAS